MSFFFLNEVDIWETCCGYNDSHSWRRQKHVGAIRLAVTRLSVIPVCIFIPVAFIWKYFHVKRALILPFESSLSARIR